MIENPEAVFKYITQGVYIISVNNGEQKNAFTAAWVMQVSFDPPLLCFSINPKHHSYQILKQGGSCCISVLNNEQYAEAAHFGQSSIKDKMEGYQWLETKTGSLALAESLAYFDCQVKQYSVAGDHQLVVCSIGGAAILNAGNPMLYSETQDMDSSSALYKK